MTLSCCAHLVNLQHDCAFIPAYFESSRAHLFTLPPQSQVAMMSRITIDLKKRAKDHIHYDLSRHPTVVDEDGPYCYQMSHIRFRDIITGGRVRPRILGPLTNIRGSRARIVPIQPPTPARSPVLRPREPPLMKPSSRRGIQIAVRDRGLTSTGNPHK